MNNAWLTFDPVFPLLLSIGIVVVLLFFFIWFEWKRQAPYLTARLIAITLTMLAIAGVLLRPRYRVEQSDKILLLTGDYDQQKADSVLKIHPGLVLIHTVDAKPYRNSIALRSYRDLFAIQHQLAYVAGPGLPAHALDLLDQFDWKFIPSAYPTGVVEIATPVQTHAKTLQRLEGIFNSDTDNTTLWLEGPGGKEDSVIIRKKGFQRFELSFTPKTPGKFLYTLHTSTGSVEKIPVSVKDALSLNILFLQKYPTFESRELKNYLAKKHQLVFRYEPSRNRFRYEYINRKPQSIDRLNERSLKDFDLLLIDSDVLQTLSRAETQALQNSVKEGLGTIVLFNEKPSGPRKNNFIVPLRFNSFDADTAHIFIRKSGNTILPAWPSSASSAEPIIAVTRNKNRILSGYISSGFGKAAFQLLQETYSISLKGDSSGYSALWSPLIEQTSRRKQSRNKLSIKSAFPVFPDEPVSVQLISGAEHPGLQYQSEKLAVSENLLIDDVWESKVWAERSGWHTLSAEDSTQDDFYVSEQGSWRSLAIANRIRQNQLNNRSIGQRIFTSRGSEEMPKWIFYVLFLVSAGALWIMPKL